VSGCAANAEELDARHRLRTAHHIFSLMGAEAFAQRAARELQAAGGTARKRKAATDGQLTPQEPHIVRLVREELSKPGHRRPALHQPPHRRMAPKQDLRKAGRQLAPTPSTLVV
jgi:hypothetical protein